MGTSVGLTLSMDSPSLSGKSMISTARLGGAANRARSIRQVSALYVHGSSQGLPATDLGKMLAYILHWASGEKGALEFLVLEPLSHPVDHVDGALIGHSGAPEVGLRLVQCPHGLVCLPELWRVANLPSHRQRPREGC